MRTAKARSGTATDRMRVAIDATPLTLSSGGLARYTAELAPALSSQFSEDEYLLVSHGAERGWWIWGAQREMDRLGADLFHGTNFEAPYLPLRPSVLSLHDLSPWMDRGWHHAADRVRRRTPALIKLGIATMVIVGRASGGVEVLTRPAAVG